MLRIDTIHNYEHPVLGTPAHCRLRISDTETGAVVIFSELAINPGVSIAGTMTLLATQVANSYLLNHENTRWFEWNKHCAPSDVYAGESIYEIRYEWAADLVATEPEWRIIRNKEFLDFIELVKP